MEFPFLLIKSAHNYLSQRIRDTIWPKNEYNAFEKKIMIMNRVLQTFMDSRPQTNKSCHTVNSIIDLRSQEFHKDRMIKA